MEDDRSSSNEAGEALLFELFEQLKEQYKVYLTLAGNGTLPGPQIPREPQSPTWDHPLSLVVEER